MFKLKIALCLLMLSQVAIAQFRDPTKPANMPTAEHASTIEIQGIVLSATWLSPLAKHATLNGKTLKQGESFNDLTLLKVNRNSVLIKHQGLIKTLYLIPASYKSNH
ncbi:MAG: hypothetical protein RQ733_12920 [Methyloprofundus sp.]|nr:hypothetical protein [Methyloprofundus sp.]MDT8426863.1 hypothetical protein [Methyloprofundus sp.]